MNMPAKEAKVAAGGISATLIDLYTVKNIQLQKGGGKNMYFQVFLSLVITPNLPFPILTLEGGKKNTFRPTRHLKT